MERFEDFGGGGNLELVPQGFKGLFKKLVSVQAIRFGFTLAEVLITLGIIGVVAALTMPALIANHQKQVTVSNLKKFYSAMSQAKILAEQEYGEMTGWDFPEKNKVEENQKFFDTYFRKHLNVIKTCTSSSECNLYDGSSATYILSDGIEFSFAPNDINSTLVGTYIYVKVDINGNKLPNRDGRDIFHLDIFPEHGVAMLGIVSYMSGVETSRLVSREELKNGMLINEGSSTACCSSSCSNERYKYLTCGALIQMDGWQIAKDYPW